MEGLALLTFATTFYYLIDGNWLVFIVLLFAVDIFMLGYLINPRIGSIAYNIGHSMILPLLLLTSGLLNNWELAVHLSLIWLAHIGLDRMLGYGLKFADSFKHTHLGNIGRK